MINLSSFKHKHSVEAIKSTNLFLRFICCMYNSESSFVFYDQGSFCALSGGFEKRCNCQELSQWSSSYRRIV